MIETRHLWIALAVIVASNAGCEGSPSGITYEGLQMEPGPHVLLDNYFFEEVTGITRVPQAPVRFSDNPVVSSAQHGVSTPYFSVIREAGRYRLWYNRPVDDTGTDASLLGYLESSDGIAWHQSAVVAETPEGGIRFGASVVKRPEGGYAIGYHQFGALTIATSQTGLTWSLLGNGQQIRHDHDISGLAYDPIRGHYIGILSTLRSETYGGPAGTDSRQTQQSVSSDLVNWATPWDVLTPDFRDEEGTQFYAMDGFLARGPLLISMVKILRDDLTSAGGVGGMGWTTLAWSRDGRTWERDRAIFLEPDPVVGSWDHSVAWIDEQVSVGDSIYLYYGGYAAGHKGDRDTDRQIGMATLARDRYVGWSGNEGGRLKTRLLRFRGERLTFNVDAAFGEMKVAVVDADGNDLAGRCEPIVADGLDIPLKCERELSEIDEPVRLLIDLRSATLFAWTLDQGT